MSNMTRKAQDMELDEILQLAAEDRKQVNGTLMERVLADAYRVQDDIAAGDPQTAKRSLSKSGISALIAAFGGWRPVSGLATAIIAGVWLGYAPPAIFDEFAAGIWSGAAGYELGDFLMSSDSFLVEG